MTYELFGSNYKMWGHVLEACAEGRVNQSVNQATYRRPVDASVFDTSEIEEVFIALDAVPPVNSFHHWITSFRVKDGRWFFVAVSSEREYHRGNSRWLRFSSVTVGGSLQDALIGSLPHENWLYSLDAHDLLWRYRRTA